MRELVFLLEEMSARALLESLLPRVLSQQVAHRLIPFEGKQDLERQHGGFKWLSLALLTASFVVPLASTLMTPVELTRTRSAVVPISPCVQLTPSDEVRIRPYSTGPAVVETRSVPTATNCEPAQMTLCRTAGRAHVPLWHSPAQYCTVQLAASTELRTTASPELSLPTATYREPDQATLCKSSVTPDVRAAHVAKSADTTIVPDWPTATYC